MILKHELLKIVKMPIIPILIVFFVVLNISIVLSHSYVKDDLSVLTGLVDRYGYEINADMLSELGTDYKKKVAWVNQVAPNNNTVYEHPSDLLSDQSFRYENSLSKSDYDKLLNYGVIEGYYRTAQGIDEIYQDINLDANAESLIHMYGFLGGAAEEVRSQFQKLEVRLDELIDNGEHKNLFFMGKTYGMHGLLFKDLGRALIFELMILVVLITASITNYEFEHRTALISYTTKRGRKLVIDKFLAAAVANGFTIIGLVGITLAAFFLTYDYSGLWNVPISSYFNAEMPLPYISWWNLSFIEYLGIFVLLIILSQLLFMGITYSLSVYMKNTYLVFFTFAILLGVGILLPSSVPPSNNLVFLLNFNPFVLILNPHEWLMGNGPFTIHSYYEAATICVWTILLGVISVLSVYRFNRQQLQ